MLKIGAYSWAQRSLGSHIDLLNFIFIAVMIWHISPSMEAPVFQHWTARIDFVWTFRGPDGLGRRGMKKRQQLS